MNFKSSDSVESALSLANSACSGRPIRVQRCVKKAKVAVRDKQGQARKKVTKKVFRDMGNNSYQGKKTAQSGDFKRNGKKKLNRGERQKKKMSQKLLGTKKRKV